MIKSINIALVEGPETRYEGYVIGHMPVSPNHLYHQIIVSNFADSIETDNGIYAFLKALANVYLFSLTGCFEKMPEGFETIKEAFSAETDIGAELFAIALCTRPEFKRYDAHPEIPLNVKLTIYEYMIQPISYS